MIKWFSPEVGKDDLRYVEKAILNNYINDGNLVALFERSCKKLLNVKYAQTTTSGTITSAADTGTALVPTNSRAVTDFTSQGSTTAYNVPGSLDYNADNAVDFILASTEDPTS